MDIFVAGIPTSFGKKELRKLFEKYGTVKSVKVVMDRKTKVSRGLGFVEMPELLEALVAIRHLHGRLIEYNPLTVKEARPKEPLEQKK